VPLEPVYASFGEQLLTAIGAAAALAIISAAIAGVLRFGLRRSTDRRLRSRASAGEPGTAQEDDAAQSAVRVFRMPQPELATAGSAVVHDPDACVTLGSASLRIDQGASMRAVIPLDAIGEISARKTPRVHLNVRGKAWYVRTTTGPVVVIRLNRPVKVVTTFAHHVRMVAIEVLDVFSFARAVARASGAPLDAVALENAKRQMVMQAFAVAEWNALLARSAGPVCALLAVAAVLAASVAGSLGVTVVFIAFAALCWCPFAVVAVMYVDTRVRRRRRLSPPAAIWVWFGFLLLGSVIPAFAMNSASLLEAVAAGYSVVSLVAIAFSPTIYREALLVGWRYLRFRGPRPHDPGS
jgi:hypothetical protein